MNEKVLKLKESPAVICYIELLQNNISRMSSYSGIVKASMCVIYTILITIIISIKNMNQYWWIALILTAIGVILDTYYLALEKIYVKKYDILINSLNDCQLNYNNIYDMQPRNTDLKCEVLAVMISSVTSFSILGFYIMFIIISILIRFL